MRSCFTHFLLLLSKNSVLLFLFKDHVEPRPSSDSGGEGTAPFFLLWYKGESWRSPKKWQHFPRKSQGSWNDLSLKPWARNNCFDISWVGMSWLGCQERWGEYFSYSPVGLVFIHLSFMRNKVNPLISSSQAMNNIEEIICTWKPPGGEVRDIKIQRTVIWNCEIKCWARCFWRNNILSELHHKWFFFFCCAE